GRGFAVDRQAGVAEIADRIAVGVVGGRRVGVQQDRGGLRFARGGRATRGGRRGRRGVRPARPRRGRGGRAGGFGRGRRERDFRGFHGGGGKCWFDRRRRAEAARRRGGARGRRAARRDRRGRRRGDALRDGRSDDARLGAFLVQRGVGGGCGSHPQDRRGRDDRRSRAPACRVRLQAARRPAPALQAPVLPPVQR